MRAALAATVCCLLAAAGSAAAAEPLKLSVTNAVLMSLENNRALRVQRLAPSITRTGEHVAASAFDTLLSGSVDASWDRAPGAGGAFTTADRQALSVGATRRLHTGTTLEGSVDATHAGSGDSATRLGASVTQALLQGRGSDVNLAEVRQAQIDTAVSRSELRGFTESLVARVEEACWDYLLAARGIAIVERSLKLAEDQLAEVRERIKVGRLAEIEMAATEAEAALRLEALINARSALATARLKLLQLLNPPGGGGLGRDLEITDLPALPPADPDTVEAHVALAGRSRPELVQARLQLEHGDLELVRTRNGLLPRLDAFLNLGKTGYSSSFGGSLDLSGQGYDTKAGLTLRFPLGNTAARAANRRAELSRRQAEESIANLEQLVEVDVRGALIEVARLREQAAATEATQRLQEENLRAETEKFRVGKSTAFLVGQAQRNLLQAELDTQSAVAGCLKAVVELYRLEGSLLERRGIGVAAESGPTAK